MPQVQAIKEPTTEVEIAHGDVLIAAITSCTNTSNPSVMLGSRSSGQESGRTGPDLKFKGESVTGTGVVCGN